MPMGRDDTLAALKRLMPSLSKECAVARIGVFGSVARGEARPDSDIDIIVEFTTPPGYFGLVRLEDRLSSSLGRRVDLFTVGGLHPALRDRILGEVVYA